MALVALLLWAPMAVFADNQLPYQPVAADNGYVVQWDCSTNDFHKNAAGEYANEMEYNETFVLAVNIEGTDLADWIDRDPTNAGYVRGVAVDFWRVIDNKQFPGSISRLWHIRDHIYGATYNMQQVDEVWHPTTGNQTQFKARIFGFESPLGDGCSTATSAPSSYNPNPENNWYQWRGNWREGYCSPKSGTANNDFNQAGVFFQFAPFTGAMTSQMPNPMINSISYYQGKPYDDYRNIYYDSNHWVNYNGYASPFCTITPCAQFYTTDYALNTTTTTVCPLNSQSATISTIGWMTDFTYLLYRDGVLVPGSERDGSTLSTNLSWTTDQAGTYTVWYYKTSEHNNPVQMIPCTGNSEITLTSPNSCCQIDGITITIDNKNPGMGETIHVRADITGTNDGNAKTFYWEVHGANNAGVGIDLSQTVTITTDNMTYSEFDISYTQWKAIAGEYEEGGGKNNGYYTFWCKVTEDGHSCNFNKDDQVHVKKELVCPDFTWAIDGLEGLGKPMYAGGWYDISCTTPAGAPTVTITGTGVSVVNTSTNGNTTTLRIELDGTATGTITMKANSPENTAAGYKACDDTREPIVSPCEGMTAETWKIQWSNYDGHPNYQIHGGADVFLRDNNGILEADIVHTDGMDEWNLIPIGETVNSLPVYYIQNALTKRYLYRDSQRGMDGNWEYAQALLAATNAQTVDFKWVFHTFMDGAKQCTIIACVDGYTGTEENINKGVFVIHNRNWEEHTKNNGMFTNPDVPSPRMVCGKTGEQGLVSPAFRMKGMEHPATSAFGAQTALSWNGTAPADIVIVDNGDVLTYTGTRSDDLHSINRTITYESTNTSVATVDAATGQVTIVGNEGEESEIRCILEKVGCFEGDTLRYKVKVYECLADPTLSTDKTEMHISSTATLTLDAPIADGEVGAPVMQAGDESKVTLNGNTWSASQAGTYTFYYKITNADHPNCDRQSDPITIVVYDCPNNPVLTSGASTILITGNTTLTLTDATLGANETGDWVYTAGDQSKVTLTADMTWSASVPGTYTFYYKITNTSHTECTRSSNTITITVKEKEDYSLPYQPIAADGTYVVLWDCDKNDFADANTMEWGETFVFAINLAGTPLGNWVMQQPSQAGAVRTIAFDRLLVKNGDDSNDHFDLDVSRLWLIRDTIFGATFNFSQIKLRNGQFHTPANGATTGIAARLFGAEAALGDKCGNTPSVSKWWQWSNNSTYSEWGGRWEEGKYVSEDDQYLFHFAPYTGQSDPTINAQDDDPRDRWYDNGHDFSSNGYKSPCPKAWPVDQTVTIDKQTICDKESETATLTLGGSETDWEYSLYKDGTLVSASAQTGTGNALTWTIDAAGAYTVQATSTTGQHDDLMGSCTTNGERTLGIYCEPDPECPETKYVNDNDVVCDTLLPYTWHTYRDIVIAQSDLSTDDQYHDTLRTTLPNGAECDSIIYKLVLRVDICEPDPVEPDERVIEQTYCLGDEIILTADVADHYYTWSTGQTTQSIQVTPTQPGVETYTVRVYDYQIKASNNLMANGDFENYTDYHQKPAGFTSDYEYLAFDPKASGLYDTYSGKSGVYLLSCDANHTWKGYAAVKPHGGEYFAMFDAAQSGFAWRVTTNENPNMTLVQGAKYIFSYWAADLNTGSERDNPAQLQFSINYRDDATGQMKKEYLGEVMKLGVDNKWHYSETFWIAPCNSSHIEIGVEDKCNYAGPGNDFGLDDIIFQMVTGQMEYTLDKQKWILTIEDCTPVECVARIYSKWNDLLLVDNADRRYTAYQWYCDSVAIAGATGQYYYEQGKVLADDGHTYYCVATLASGEQETLCSMSFSDFPTAVSQNRKPAPAQVRVYTPAGKLLYTGTDETDIYSRLYPGCYIIYRETEDEEIITEKLIIY